MTSLCSIKPTIRYNQSFTGTNNTEQTNTSAVELKSKDNFLDIPTDKVGTTSEKVARKSIKHIWQKFTNYISEHFQKKASENNQEPKIDCEI